MSDRFISNLSDIHVDPSAEENSKDLLNIARYINALSQYISNASTPTTLAIQGEWGSGKTSLMNQLREKLCCSENDKSKPFYGVWLNMWKYSLMQSPEQILTSVIQGMTQEVRLLIESKYPKDEPYIKKAANRLSKYANPLIITGCALANAVASRYGMTLFTSLSPDAKPVNNEKENQVILVSPDQIQKDLENTIAEFSKR